jgi:hypothetical protein
MISPAPVTIAEQLQHERQALQLAEKHVSAGAERLRRQQVLVQQLSHNGIELAQAQRLSDGLNSTLAEWVRHRDMILERIAYLEHAPSIPRPLALEWRSV